jgi:S-adenosyl-L-methionine hydrolase (adenosine-forming)
MEREMNSLDLVTFLSDFGGSGGYVAACEATIARVNPAARLIHLAHDVTVGDMAAGALILARVAPLCPPAVHLAVIDPGVGTDRRSIALVTARGDILVGPDNGLLMNAAEALGGLRSAWTLDHSRVREEAALETDGVSATFHGRDVFAPAAALLARGLSPSALGAPLDPSTLVRLGRAQATVSSHEAIAEVIEVDRFGNVGLALPFADLSPKPERFTVDLPGEELPEWQARLVRTYGDLRPGELGVFCDSWGQVAIALNGASAAELLSVRRGTMVRLTNAVGESSPGPVR